METLSAVIGFIFSFKAYVMLPAVILVVGIAIRMNVGRAALSALRLGVGFAGIFIAFGFFVQQIAPAVTAMVRTRGLDFPVLDVGWPPLAAITWASPIAPITIVMVIALNFAMLALNVTRTINIDIWNYWHFALLGALVQGVTGQPPAGAGRHRPGRILFDRRRGLDRAACPEGVRPEGHFDNDPLDQRAAAVCGCRQSCL